MYPLSMATGAGGQGAGSGASCTHRTSLVYTTLSSAPRVCSELELPKGRGRRTQVPGSVIPLPSAGFALEHCRIAFLVSRPPVSSGLSFRSFGFLQSNCVRTCARVEYVGTLQRCNTAKHRTDSLILLAGMLPPPWVRQPTWALTCPGVAQASPPPASSLWLNNTYISRSLANTLSHPESSPGVHDHTQTQRNNHTRLSYLKAS